MRRRWVWVAWSMVAVYIVGLACMAVLAILNGSATGGSTYTVYLPAFTAFMVVGALVVARRPANPIGWLFSAIGLLALGAPWPMSTLERQLRPDAYGRRRGGYLDRRRTRQ